MLKLNNFGYFIKKRAICQLNQKIKKSLNENTTFYFRPALNQKYFMPITPKLFTF
jgi:hypothetical protein